MHSSSLAVGLLLLALLPSIFVQYRVFVPLLAPCESRRLAKAFILTYAAIVLCGLCVFTRHCRRRLDFIQRHHFPSRHPVSSSRAAVYAGIPAAVCIRSGNAGPVYRGPSYVHHESRPSHHSQQPVFLLYSPVSPGIHAVLYHACATAVEIFPFLVHHLSYGRYAFILEIRSLASRFSDSVFRCSGPYQQNQ